MIIIPIVLELGMQYFQAVQKGKQRAGKSQMKLFDLAGFAMLTLTTKKIDGKFVPVGEEDFTAVIKTPDGYVTILVDGDGCTKAQTKAMEKEEAMMIFQKARESNIEEYAGTDVLIWNDAYPVIQNK